MMEQPRHKANILSQTYFKQPKIELLEIYRMKSYFPNRSPPCNGILREKIVRLRQLYEVGVDRHESITFEGLGMLANGVCSRHELILLFDLY